MALGNLSSDPLSSGLPPRLLEHWQETGIQISSNLSQQHRELHQITQRRASLKAHTRRLAILGALAAVLLVSVVLGSWLITRPSLIGGKGGEPSGAITPSGADHITFAPSISYNQALRLITDLGLQPSLDCVPGRPTPGTTEPPKPVWQPVGQKETFLSDHQLQIYPTFSAPLDWRLKLRTTPGVLKIASQWSYCPHVISGTPPPGVIMPLSSNQAGNYIRITFTTSQTYDAALYAVSDLGLGLANYCYEQAELVADRGPAPSWQLTGEEHQFAKTHVLIVKTRAALTSSLWQTQLRAQPGVISIATPYTPSC
jgi:hypothetical protein